MPVAPPDTATAAAAAALAHDGGEAAQPQQEGGGGLLLDLVLAHTLPSLPQRDVCALRCASAATGTPSAG